MYRITPRCLIAVLLLILLVAAASCEKTKDSPTVVPSVESTLYTLSPTEVPQPVETTSMPTASPSPTMPPEIVFDMSGDQDSTYMERLYVDANISSISVIGGGEPVHISGKIADCEAYCYSISYKISQVEYAMDGSSLAILLDSNQFGSGRLVYSDRMTAVNIAASVDSFHMSGDGSAVLYLVSPKYEHGIGGDLCYYDCLTGESQLIAQGAGRLFTISPCGDSISYTTFYKADNPDALTCYTDVIGKAPTVLDTDSYCAAISDDAKTVYYLKKTSEGEILTVNFNGAAKQLSLPYNSPEYYDQEHAFYFNIDHTQIVFNSGGSAYFSMSGSDPFKISGSLTSSFAGPSHYDDVPDYLFKTIADSARSYFTISVYGTKNLCYVPFRTGERDLLFFDENMSITEYSLPEYTYDISFDGNSLICSDSFNGTIYKNYLDPDTEKIPSCISPCYTEDQTLYFLTAADPEKTDENSNSYDLYVSFDSFDSAEKELVASNVSSPLLFERDGPDILYFFAYPEGYNEEIQLDYNLTPFLDLYTVEETPGAKPVLVARKVCMVDTGDFGVIYRQYKSEFKDDFDPSGGSYMATVGVYYSKDGTSFQYVMERPYVNQFGG